MPSHQLPDLPPPDRLAILLDFDGTLVDIAPAPDKVVVPDGLRDALSVLRVACGDALAVITGRPIAQIDHFLPDLPYAVAGEHGSAIRHAPGEAVDHVVLPELPEEWLDRAEAMVAGWSGAHVERKQSGFVLHFRAVPEAGEPLRAALEDMIAPRAADFHILSSKMAWELRPVGSDKGSALEAVMARPPFAGRVPLFIGDDVTDRDAIEAAERAGGIGLMVPERFGEPADVRAWLGELAARQGGAR
ncbi:trehalose 6-phosphate phosphatase [Endobacter medicaginis]|uniref:Trehalose 6-phosphate phosphatase n=2 Tax=Endobacter medicaginis TaxID=1181271 RepID=A0A839UVK3_9PROT|nr:trehalose-phosphatase [Endobacter medicaginis]MBB3172675.1 trehalose 6-phosphate phosphatase [Endobacter medicaginis]MCX5475681.1 trehalose-phosphatase [Endobacter medicaginis]